MDNDYMFFCARRVTLQYNLLQMPTAVFCSILARKHTLFCAQLFKSVTPRLRSVMKSHVHFSVNFQQVIIIISSSLTFTRTASVQFSNTYSHRK